MRNLKKILTSLTVLTSLVSMQIPQQAYALGAVSRACQHSKIPAQFPFILRFTVQPSLVGGILIPAFNTTVTKTLTRSNLPAYTTYYQPLFAQTPSLEERYWSLESFTTDYFLDAVVRYELPGRYWLWASADTWALSNVDSNGNLNPNGEIKESYYKNYKSQWANDPQQTDVPRLPGYEFVPEATIKNFLFRARAGTETPGFIDRYFVDLSYTVGYGFFPVKPVDFKIEGTHAYYDPLKNLLRPLAKTQANSCNFEHWGFALERPYQ